MDTEHAAIEEIAYLKDGPPSDLAGMKIRLDAIRLTLERHYIRRQDGTIRFISGIDEIVLTEIAAHSLPWIIQELTRLWANVDDKPVKKPSGGKRSKPLF